MIALTNVSKRFRLYGSPSARLLEWLHLGHHHQEFHALRDVTLSVPEGRTVGIVGVNGAGKSTLLKLITGTLLPSEGTIEIRGRVAALLELGMGFHPEFTGRQNISVNGQLLGISAEKIRELEPEIIAFSELGAFIDQPLRTYSSGMVVRLGFSIAAAVRPEVLIIDEALSVGDARFSQKCIRRIREFRDDGATILFVSHDPAAISMLCDEAVLLEGGRIEAHGPPRDILEEYNALLAAKGSGNVEMRISRASREVSTLTPRRHGTFQAIISHMELNAASGLPSDVFAPTDLMTLRFRVTFLTGVESPTIGFQIKDRLGLALYGTNTALLKQTPGRFQPGECADIEVRIPLRLGYGDYSVTVAVHEDETHLEKCYEWADNAALFHVRHSGKPDWSGLVMLDAQTRMKRGHITLEELEPALLERFGSLPDPLPLEYSASTPYLSGFFPAVESKDGWSRRVGTSACFLFRAQHRFLALRSRATVPVDALPMEVQLVISHIEAHISALQEQVDNTLLFELPEDVVGRLVLYRMEVLASRQSIDGSVIELHRIASGARPQESTQWPITTRTRLSKT